MAEMRARADKRRSSSACRGDQLSFGSYAWSSNKFTLYAAFLFFFFFSCIERIASIVSELCTTPRPCLSDYSSRGARAVSDRSGPAVPLSSPVSQSCGNVSSIPRERRAAICVTDGGGHEMHETRTTNMASRLMMVHPSHPVTLSLALIPLQLVKDAMPFMWRPLCPIVLRG